MDCIEDCKLTEKYSVNLPYPSIAKVRENKIYANMIFKDYSGPASELTAVTQYGYQNVILEERDKATADILLGISIVEMTHLHILGDLLIKLGADPKYVTMSNRNTRFWNGGFVKYSKSFNKIILDDIEAEATAINTYEKQILMIDDEHITALLQRIVLDEKYHIHIFKSLLMDK